MSGLEGLAGTPQRVASPAVQNGAHPPPPTNMDDLMGLSEMGGTGGGIGGMSSGMGSMGSGVGGLAGMSGLSDSNQDILNGFASLDMSGSNQPPPAHEQLSMGGGSGSGSGQKQNDDDLLGLF